MDILQGYFVLLLEMSCCKIFFEIFCKKRKSSSKYKDFLLVILLSICVFTVGIILNSFFVVRQLIIFALISIAMKICMKQSIRKTVFLTIIYLSVLLISDYIIILIHTSIFLNTGRGSESVNPLVIILVKSVFLCIMVFLRYIVQLKQEIYLKDADWIKFSFFPLFSICIMIAMIYNIQFIIDKEQEKIFWIVAFGMIIMNGVVFYFLRDISERERKLREKEIFEIEAKNQLKLYQTISENVMKQREKEHEYKNQIACIYGLFQSKQYEKLNQYIQQISTSMLHELDFMDTQNAIVNAVINVKYREAVEKGIVIVIKANDLSGIQILDQDVVLLLSNLLNNAIEACEKCFGQKRIKIKFVHEKEEVILSVKNTFDGKVEYKDSEIVTTKVKDTQNHGIGLRNVKKVVEKYDGFYTLNHTENEFSVLIIIPQVSNI